jgi:hypothetical protein
MALELKGLKGQAIKAAANIERLNRAYGAFNEAAPAHAADVEGLTPQIAALQDDLTFAAQVLGNSVAGSNAGAAEKPREQAVEKKVVTASEVGDVNPLLDPAKSPVADQMKPGGIAPTHSLIIAPPVDDHGAVERIKLNSV